MARRTEPTVRMRLLKSEHEHWSRLKQHRGLSTDNDVAWYLWDLADFADVSIAPGSVALSSSIVPGVAKSGVLFTRVLLQNCVQLINQSINQCTDPMDMACIYTYKKEIRRD